MSPIEAFGVSRPLGDGGGRAGGGPAGLWGGELKRGADYQGETARVSHCIGRSQGTEDPRPHTQRREQWAPGQMGPCGLMGAPGRGGPEPWACSPSPCCFLPRPIEMQGWGVPSSMFLARVQVRAAEGWAQPGCPPLRDPQAPSLALASPKLASEH